MEVGADALQRAIQDQHDGQSVWDGTVHVFDLDVEPFRGGAGGSAACRGPDPVTLAVDVDREGDPLRGHRLHADDATQERGQVEPYHGSLDSRELHTAFGREWSCGCYWVFHTWGLAAVGQATSGKPWLRGDLHLGLNFQDTHSFRLVAKSYWGLGSKETVPLADFDGWGDIRHQSIDLGGSYRYQFGCYGSLRFDYMRRVFAHSYPEEVNFFLFTFEYPFSVL